MADFLEHARSNQLISNKSLTSLGLFSGRLNAQNRNFHNGISWVRRLVYKRAALLAFFADFLALLIGAHLASYQAVLDGPMPAGFAPVSVIGVLLALLLAVKLDTYAPTRLASVRHRTRCSLSAVLCSGGLITFSFVVTGKLDFKLWMIHWGLSVGFFVMLSSIFTALAFKKLVGVDGFATRVALVGTALETRALAERLLRQNAGSIRVVGNYDDVWDGSRQVDSGSEAPRKFAIEILQACAEETNIQAIILAMPSADIPALPRLVGL